MKKRCFAICVCALVLMIIVSCEKEDNRDVWQKKGVPEAIQSDFTSRYPVAEGYTVTNARYWDHLNYDGYAEIDFTTKDGLKGTAVYTDDSWKMTYTVLHEDSFLKEVPDLVVSTWKTLGYDGQISFVKDWSNGVFYFERDGLEEGYYEFIFNTPVEENGETIIVPHSVIIDKLGNMLLNYRGALNNSFWFPDMSECFEKTKTMYPYAGLTAGVNAQGDNVIIIWDGNWQRRVFFRHIYDWQWTHTQTPLRLDTVLPDYVEESVRAFLDEHPEYDGYSGIYRDEYPNGRTYYLFDFSTLAFSYQFGVEEQ